MSNYETQRALADKLDSIIHENKDKWLKEMGLGLELPVAESESSQAASKDKESVSPTYPVKEAQDANANDHS